MALTVYDRELILKKMNFYEAVSTLNHQERDSERNPLHSEQATRKLQKLAQDIKKAGDYFVKYGDKDRLKTMCIWAINEYGEMNGEEYRALQPFKTGAWYFYAAGSV
jgi:hypothetical protein